MREFTDTFNITRLELSEFKTVEDILGSPIKIDEFFILEIKVIHDKFRVLAGLIEKNYFKPEQLEVIKNAKIIHNYHPNYKH